MISEWLHVNTLPGMQKDAFAQKVFLAVFIDAGLYIWWGSGAQPWTEAVEHGSGWHVDLDFEKWITQNFTVSWTPIKCVLVGDLQTTAVRPVEDFVLLFT